MAAGIPLVPTHPSDPYSWAVQQATQQYPRLAQFPPMRLTYNPKREGYSETFSPVEPANPYKGNWTVEMGESPYYYTPNSWPGLVALESLHMMQELDPRYQQMTQHLAGTLTDPQRTHAQAYYNQQVAQEHDPRTFDQFIKGVYLPELIRSRMFHELFERMEPGSTKGGYQATPEQVKLIDAIDQYMRSSGRTPITGGR